MAGFDGPAQWRMPGSVKASGVRYSDPAKRLEFKGLLSKYRRALAGETSKWDTTDYSVDDQFGYDDSLFFRRDDSLFPEKGRVQPGMASSARRSRASSSGEPEVFRGSPANSPRNTGGPLYRSKDWQPFDDPRRRLGGLSGVGSGGAGKAPTATTAFLSRYGANKSFGDGVLGMSASRIRSSKEFMSHPETWIKRAWIPYVADEVSRAYMSWRHWNRVDYAMDDSEAKAALASERVKDFGEFAIGTVMGVGTNLFGIMHRTSIAAGSAFGIIEESSAAKEASFFEDYGDWASGGFHGPGPKEILSRLPHEMEVERGRRAARSKGKAISRFDALSKDFTDRFAFALSLRGVNPYKVASRWKNTAEGRAVLENMQKLQLESDTKKGVFSEVDIKKAALNRLRAER